MLFRVTELYGKRWDKEAEFYKRWANPGLWDKAMPIEKMEYIYHAIDCLLLPSPFKYQLEALPEARTVLRLFCFGDDYRAFRQSLGQLAKYFNVPIILRRASYGNFWEADEIPCLQIVIHEPQNVGRIDHEPDSDYIRKDTYGD